MHAGDVCMEDKPNWGMQKCAKDPFRLEQAKDPVQGPPRILARCECKSWIFGTPRFCTFTILIISFYSLIYCCWVTVSDQALMFQKLHHKIGCVMFTPSYWLNSNTTTCLFASIIVPTSSYDPLLQDYTLSEAYWPCFYDMWPSAVLMGLQLLILTLCILTYEIQQAK